MRKPEIGRKLAKALEGEEGEPYVVDVVLRSERKLDEVKGQIEAAGGRVPDTYIQDGLVLLRAICSGNVVRNLLESKDVAYVDEAPRWGLEEKTNA